MTHEDDKTLAEALAAARSAGHACVLATIVGTRGSTPRKVGARMLVDPSAGLTGTVGGGCGEAEVIESAYRVLETGVAERVHVDLTEDFTTWSPAVCGGVMDIFVEVVGVTNTPATDDKAP
ncbi:MAG: XdhC family protein [Gemmatimonadota bacterium]|nr:XdhC family protein [Gemmatimonadota bacterium]MDE3007299.1 XdhC family protein [Gemmatimonadota bacterium]MDE3014014.1 XdhC family protein [Gemmatimonadota bacterium]